GDSERGSLLLPYYEKATASKTFKAEHEGNYQINLDITVTERFVDNEFDYNKCRMIFKIDGAEIAHAQFTRESGRAFHYKSDQKWAAGDHQFAVEIEPLTPGEKQVRSLAVRIDLLTVRGPMDEKYWVRPKNYDRF